MVSSNTLTVSAPYALRENVTLHYKILQRVLTKRPIFLNKKNLQWLKMQIMQSINIFLFKFRRSALSSLAVRLTVDSPRDKFVYRLFETLKPIISGTLTYLVRNTACEKSAGFVPSFLVFYEVCRVRIVGRRILQKWAKCNSVLCLIDFQLIHFDPETGGHRVLKSRRPCVIFQPVVFVRLLGAV